MTTYHHKDDNNYWIVENPHHIDNMVASVEETLQDSFVDHKVPQDLQAEQHESVYADSPQEHADHSVLSSDALSDNLDESLFSEKSKYILEDANDAVQPPPTLKAGDTIRLRHSSTNRNLHCSYGVHAYLSKSDLEVSGFGNDTMVPDQNDHWIIEEISKQGKGLESPSIRNILTSFRLKHSVTGCYLASSKGTLPDWASNQLEVSCELNSPKKIISKNTIWNFETNFHPQRKCSTVMTP